VASLLGPVGEVVLYTEEKFEAFYRSDYPQAARLAYLLCGSQMFSDDLVQEAFLSIEPRFDHITNPSAYLRTTIVHLSASLHRRDRRRAGLLPRMYSDKSLSAESGELFDVLATLPHGQRAALTLRFWCGLNVAEIAEVLGCRPGTVKSSISRGLDRLRIELKDPT
jgi:RNA polymerase sigma factor (sigma-70 family)